MERLIVCQGTANLVTAVLALQEHSKRVCTNTDPEPSRDHLLICGLAVSEKQADEFAFVIERMATLLHPFASINRLAESTLSQLIYAAQRVSSAPAIERLFKRATGLGAMDEIFTVREWQDCNELALGSYPDAIHVCYGDSVGVYLPPGFMSPKPTPWSWVGAQLRRRLKTRKSQLDKPRVDFSYLLLPGAFGMPPGGEVIQTQAATLRKMFASLSPLLDGDELADIREKTSGRSVWVLLGSNFSEQGLMTPESEASAYRDWIKGLHPEPGAVLLIKSHPRDDKSKRALLEQHLVGLFDEVWSVDSVGSSYLPVEVLLLELGSIVGSLRCLTVSTACLATHFVLESKTDIGLGEALVTRYMTPDRRQQRLQHERDLRRLCVV